MDSTAMSWREHIRQNMRLALPLMIGQLATIGIWTSDTIAMGWIDSSSLAAGALASRFYQPFFFLALGISLAVGPLVAQGIGAGDERQVRRAFRQGMVIAVTLGLATAPLLLFGEQVLVLLGQDPGLAAIGQPFLFWSSFGLPFMFLSVVLRQFLISHQRPMPQVIALIIALAANVTLNEAFVSGIGPFPAMGLAGIALATTIVYALLCAGLIAYIAMIQPFRDSRPFQRLWVIDSAVTARLLRIGVPTGLTIFAEAGMFIAVTFVIGLFLTGKDAMFAEVMALALPMLLLTALFQIPDGVQAIAMSVLRGVNDTRTPAIVAITSFWILGVAVGALAGFSLGFGPTGVWGGLLLGLSVASLILTMRMMRAMRRIRDGGRILLA